MNMNKEGTCPVCDSIGFEEQCLQCGWYVPEHWSIEQTMQHLEQRRQIWYEDEKMPRNSNVESFGGDDFDQEDSVNAFFEQDEFPLEPPSIEYPMRYISGCQFQMGSPEDEEGRDADEQQHLVTLTRPYYIGLTEIPQDLWIEVFLHNPSLFRGIRRPVDSVTWFECIQFCNIYSQKMGLEPAYFFKGTNVFWNRNANGFRLPTEAEWELASRISRSEHFEKVDYAWFQQNSNWSTRSIQKPQDDELLDFSGNVWEWCWDLYGLFTKEPQIDPIGVTEGEERVLKGGSYVDDIRVLRPANRAFSEPSKSSDNIGFRIVRNYEESSMTPKQ